MQNLRFSDLKKKSVVFENYLSIISFNSPKLKNNRFYLNVVKHLFFNYIKFVLSKESLMYERIHIFADTLILIPHLFSMLSVCTNIQSVQTLPFSPLMFLDYGTRLCRI